MPDLSSASSSEALKNSLDSFKKALQID